MGFAFWNCFACLCLLFAPWRETPQNFTPRRKECNPLEIPSQPEAEYLLSVAWPLDDGEAEIQRDGHRPEHRHHEADAEARRHAITFDLPLPLPRAGIDEGHQVDLIIGLDRVLVFDAVEKHEIAADAETVRLRADTAEREAAQRAETASVEALEDRSVRA